MVKESSSLYLQYKAKFSEYLKNKYFDKFMKISTATYAIKRSMRDDLSPLMEMGGPERDLARGSGVNSENFLQLKKFADHPQESFSQRLFRLIDAQGMKDSEIYKAAGFDRKYFNKIRNIKNFTPSKDRIFLLILALRLNLADSRDLLASAGYAFSDNCIQDMLVEWCMMEGLYDIPTIQDLLYDLSGKTLLDD